MAPIRVANSTVSALDSKQQSPTQAFVSDFPPATANVPVCVRDAKALNLAEPTPSPISPPLPESWAPSPTYAAETNTEDPAAEETPREPFPSSAAASATRAKKSKKSSSKRAAAAAAATAAVAEEAESTDSSTDSAAVPSASSTSLLTRLRRSRFLAPFMVERAVKENLILPTPIHRLYCALDARQRAAAGAALPSRPLASPTSPSTHTGSDDVDLSSAAPAAAAALPPPTPRGDVYNFMFNRREVAELRTRQRRYFRAQLSSPHAPQLVHLDDVAEALLHECEIAGTVSEDCALADAYVQSEADPTREEPAMINATTTAATTTMTTSQRVAELLSIFCTRGIPQDEYIEGVFQYRMGVLQKSWKSTPIGTVVPSLAQPDVCLADAVATRECRREAGTAGKGSKPKNATEPTVTYPHPGTPYTFEDLVRDPVQLSAAERLERRSALLHRRTLSEDVYGEPTPYM